MKKNEYVWVVYDCGSPKVFRFPSQIRLLAKENGYSVFDEYYVDSNKIVFSKKNYHGEKGFYALKLKIG